SAHCAGGKCVPRVALGKACGSDDECALGADAASHCVDGVCCDGACGGICEACNIDTSLGSCTAVVGDPHGTRPKCGADPSQPVCGKLACDGKTRSKCAGLPGAETTCAPGSCKAGTETLPGRCGAGVCAAGETHECAPFACAGEACATSCNGPSDCAP